MIAEGYTADYKQQFGSSDRTTVLKSGAVVKLSEIPTYFKDEQAIKDILDFRRYKRLGFPRANWEECDNRLVQMVEYLIGLDELYHPPTRLV